MKYLPNTTPHHSLHVRIEEFLQIKASVGNFLRFPTEKSVHIQIAILCQPKLHKVLMENMNRLPQKNLDVSLKQP